MQASRSKIACCIIDWLRMLKFHHTLLQYNLHSWVHIFTKELRWGPALKRTKFILFKENYSKFCFRMQLCGSHCYSTILFPHATVNSNKMVLPDVCNLRFLGRYTKWFSEHLGSYFIVLIGIWKETFACSEKKNLLPLSGYNYSYMYNTTA